MISSLSNQLAFVLVLFFLGTIGLGQSYAQDAQDDQAKAQQRELSDMELIERVAFLQRELEAPEIPKRDEAEKELIGLGVRVLDYLEAADEKTTTQAVERLGRIRQHLEKIAVAAVTKASLVNLSGKVSVGKALEKIKQQTGNDVRLPEGVPDLSLIHI